MRMPGILSGRAAVVTGSGQSIGRSIALLLAQEGAAVVTNSRSAKSRDDTPTAHDTAEEIKAAGGRAIPVFADVGTMAGAAAVVDGCISEFGGLDILVNNAGFGATHRIADMTEAQWDAVLDVNLKACYATAHFAVPHMTDRRYGRILNVISRVGLAGSATMSAYAAAKAGAMGFTFALAKELAADGITVNCLAPTANTVRAQRTATERYAMTGRVIPGSPNRTPDHVAPMVAYLVSEGAGGITGRVFYAAAGEITLYDPPTPARSVHKLGRWTTDELVEVVPVAFGVTLGPPESPLPPSR
jgi:3-oxoacyl-[acyl-carrier protein] reductase